MSRFLNEGINFVGFRRCSDLPKWKKIGGKAIPSSV
jgi:hypothetical protein